MENQFDVLVIGGGAVGCAIARELSRYDLKIGLLEKECDVAGGTSGRNSAVVHAGFNNKPGSLMAKFCVEGNRGFEEVCRELDVPYNKTGKLLVAFDEEEMATLERLVRQGERNGCQGLHLIGKEEVERLCPNVGGIGAMHSPNTAIFDPFQYTVALAENAVKNGVNFFLNSEVTAIRGCEGAFEVEASGKTYCAKLLINSAGMFSDQVAAMAGVEGYQLYPCRGEYLILDKIAAEKCPIPIYPAPHAGIGGLGIHITPTIHGNIILGPSADYIDQREDWSTTRTTLDCLMEEAQQLMPTLKRQEIIGSYAGIRSKQAPPEEGGFRDFVILEEPKCPGLIDLIGIESPGMTASMPIARMVTGMVTEKLHPARKADFDPTRVGILRFADQSDAEKARLIAEDPDYGEIVCRCQQVTKKEIRQAIENPLGARSISAIKYRAWPTTGRCQGGYCLTRIVEMLEREYGIPPEDMTQRGVGSELFTGRVKG